MRSMIKLAAGVVALLMPLAAGAATIGGAFYATQYDYRDFWAATDGKDFRVILAGNAFPTLPEDDAAQRLLPVMQVAKPRPALTFTYQKPVPELRPDYRLVLVFDAANDLNGDRVCQGETRFKPGTPGLLNIFAVYCRNDMVMSMTTARTPAALPEDRNVDQLFRELFMVVFNDSQTLRPQSGTRRN
ncbi:MAG: hypothetical protein Q8N31_12350 [Reyranella sp.]|nr:hypothetical protein [Reyranella sp.]